MDTGTIIPDANSMVAGAKGFECGQYVGMSRADYDSAPGISHSMLKDWVAGKKTNLGRKLIVQNALHKVTEDVDAFKREYLEIKDVDLRTPTGRTYLEASERESGKIAIRDKEIKVVRSMYAAIANHPMGRKYIDSPAKREVAVFHTIDSKDSDVLPEHPTMMKGILDRLGNNVSDLKTVGWPSPEQFKNNIVKYGYDSQAALYRELAAKEIGEYKRFFWLCVLFMPPHYVWVEEPTPYMLASGLRWIDTTLSLYERFSNV